MQNDTPALKLLFACALLIIPLIAFSETDSELRKFEEDVTRPHKAEKSQRHSRKSPDRKESADDVSESGGSKLEEEIVSAVVEIMIDAVMYPGLYSLERVTPAALNDEYDEYAATPRTLGEGVIPYARLDMSYNRVSSDVYAMSARAEIGYGPFGFEVRRASYSETDPGASLDVQQYHVLYRMSLEDHVELDLGLGEYELNGVAQNSGKSSTVHLLIHPSEQFGIEVRPSWATINGNGIRDHELAISYGERFWAARAGYHWLESPAASLNGPFVGFSVRY